MVLDNPSVTSTGRTFFAVVATPVGLVGPLPPAKKPRPPLPSLSPPRYEVGCGAPSEMRGAPPLLYLCQEPDAVY